MQRTNLDPGLDLGKSCYKEMYVLYIKQQYCFNVKFSEFDLCIVII